MSKEDRPNGTSDPTVSPRGDSAAEGRQIEGRRRVLKGMAAAPVIYTVAGRPAWANGVCTRSILLSGNLSAHPEQQECEFGCSPGFWRNVKDKAWTDAGYSRSDSFFETFGLGALYTDPDAEPESDVFYDATLMDAVSPSVPEIQRDMLKAAAFHAVAGLLNASHPDIAIGIAYPYTADVIREGFRNAYGNYLATGDKSSLEAFKNDLDDYDSGRVCPLNHHGDYEL